MNLVHPVFIKKTLQQTNLKAILYIFLMIMIFAFYDCNEGSIIDNIQQEEDQYSIEVIDFFSATEEFYSFYNDSLGWQKNFTIDEINNISFKYYNAIYKNYTDYYYYFLELHKEWEKEVINNNYVIIHTKPALKLKKIRDKIAVYKSSAFAELLQIPFFLRVRIIKKENSFYYSESAGLTLRQTDMVVKVEDVVKGEYKFTKNDTITISYLNDWYNFSKNHFEIGKSYFIPFKPWRIENKSNYYYGVNFLPDYNDAVYPIIDEYIKTPGDYFNLEEIMNWLDFKYYFIQNYLIGSN